ncbi:hypothetical protein FOMPIDRAFT_94635, partial [Fomitopsis schrenkii]
KRALTFGFRGGWLVNGARASPTNFSSSCMGAQRPVICFLDQPIIHITFGLVEYSNLITVSASGRKSISLTVMDTEFDLAWAYYCTVFGGQNMELYVPQNNPYIVFSTYPSNNNCSTGSAPSTPATARFKKFVKGSKAQPNPHLHKLGTVVNKRRPAAISKLLQGGTNRHVVGPDADIPVWDATAYFTRDAVPGSFDLEAIDSLPLCKRMYEEPSPSSLVAVFHSVTTYNQPPTLSLNVLGALVLVAD